MNMFTALSLSFHNLWTKRSRTLLTAFAGSIGIIGIALIAALSSGVDDYIYQQEAKMAYQYPLLVETLNMDVSSMLSDLNGNLAESGQDQVEVIGFLEKLFAMLDTNDLELLREYLDRDENEIAQYGTVEYVYNVQPQIYVEYGQSFRRVCPDSTLDSLGIPVSTIDTSLISSSVSTNINKICNAKSKITAIRLRSSARNHVRLKRISFLLPAYLVVSAHRFSFSLCHILRLRPLYQIPLNYLCCL